MVAPFCCSSQELRVAEIGVQMSTRELHGQEDRTEREDVPSWRGCSLDGRAIALESWGQEAFTVLDLCATASASQLGWETAPPRSGEGAVSSHRHFGAEGLHPSTDEKEEGEPAPNSP